MVLSVDFQATLSWHQLKKVVQNSLPEDEPEADEAADVADAADSFQGKKCSEKGLASDINTSKVCLQTTAEAPGWMEMVEVIEAVWPPLFLPPLLPAQKKRKQIRNLIRLKRMKSKMWSYWFQDL